MMRPRQMKTTLSVLAVVGAAALVAGAVAAIASGTKTASAHRTGVFAATHHMPAPIGNRPHAHVTAASQISALNRPVKPIDALPASVEGMLERGGGQSAASGIDWSDARRVGPGMWLAGAGTNVCLFIDTGSAGMGLSCGPADGIADGNLLITGAWGGASHTDGVVPNGVSSVTMHFTDGSTQVVPVTDNAYRVTGSVPADQVTFTGENGQVAEPLAVP
jgi:hypothetical protein